MNLHGMELHTTCCTQHITLVFLAQWPKPVFSALKRPCNHRQQLSMRQGTVHLRKSCKRPLIHQHSQGGGDGVDRGLSVGVGAEKAGGLPHHALTPTGIPIVFVRFADAPPPPLCLWVSGTEPALSLGEHTAVQLVSGTAPALSLGEHTAVQCVSHQTAVAQPPALE
jgi:hypothetical protein